MKLLLGKKTAGFAGAPISENGGPNIKFVF